MIAQKRTRKRNFIHTTFKKEQTVFFGYIISREAVKNNVMPKKVNNRRSTG